jgi:hypothetical protein
MNSRKLVSDNRVSVDKLASRIYDTPLNVKYRARIETI